MGTTAWKVPSFKTHFPQEIDWELNEHDKEFNKLVRELNEHEKALSELVSELNEPFICPGRPFRLRVGKSCHEGQQKSGNEGQQEVGEEHKPFQQPGQGEDLRITDVERTKT